MVEWGLARFILVELIWVEISWYGTKRWVLLQRLQQVRTRDWECEEAQEQKGIWGLLSSVQVKTRYCIFKGSTGNWYCCTKWIATLAKVPVTTVTTKKCMFVFRTISPKGAVRLMLKDSAVAAERTLFVFQYSCGFVSLFFNCSS